MRFVKHPDPRDDEFELTEKQAEALALLRESSAIKELLMLGGSRCVAWDSFIDGYAENIECLSKGTGSIYVHTANGVRRAERPYYKGTDYLYAVTTESGKTIKVTDDHRFWTQTGWQKLLSISSGTLIATRGDLKLLNLYDLHILDRKAPSIADDTPNPSGFVFEKIVSIQKTANPEKYYTTTVDDCQQYFANGILNHNSGKTFFGIHLCVVRAMKYPYSRHIVCRLRFAHAKTSLWLDTIPKVLKVMGLVDKRDYKLNRSDFVVIFKNGAELWIDGLDNAERVEKMLGREYNTIYYNEISQIPYDTVTTVQSRLAMRSVSPVYGICRNLALFDCNPPTKKHWSYFIWFLHKDPSDVRHPELNEKRVSGLAFIKMNPTDNLRNVGEDYISILNNLPERKRKRFLDGDYADVEGAIFENWTIVHAVPEEIRKVAVCTLGGDFGFTVDPAVMLRIWYVRGRGRAKDQVWIEQLVYARDLTNPKLAKATYIALLSRTRKAEFASYRVRGGEKVYDDWLEEEYEDNMPLVAAYMDPHEPKSITELQEYWTENECGILSVPGAAGPDFDHAGIDWLQGTDIFVVEDAVDVIEELETYEYKKDAEGMRTIEPITTNNHAMDALRYGCSTYITRNTASVMTLIAN